MRFSKIILYGVFLTGFAMQAQAETFCAKHDTLSELLNSRFGEQQLGVGLAGKEAMVELYVSKKGTFTLVSTDKEGISCIFGAGDSWEKLEPKETASAM